jgi:hypothetical protein
VYGTLIRNAGWTFAECGEQPACDVFDFLEHLQEYPPAYVILSAVHMKPKAKKAVVLTDEAMQEQSRQMRATMPTAPLTPHLRELIAWNQQQLEMAAKKGKPNV